MPVHLGDRPLQSLESDLNPDAMDQWVQRFSHLPEAAVYSRHQQQQKDLRAARDHHSDLVSQVCPGPARATDRTPGLEVARTVLRCCSNPPRHPQSSPIP